MRGHELVAVAVRETRTVLPVERTQLRGELPGRGLASQLRADPLRDLGEPDGVEPDVRVESILTVLALAELEALEQVDRRVAALGGVLSRPSYSRT